MDKTDNEMVERLAAIIGREARHDWTDQYRPNVRWPDDYSELEAALCRNAARAAIEAMREPTEEMVVDIIGGNCPVQAEGTVDGKPFYFRARGNKWSMGIGDDPVGIPHPHKIVDGKLVNPYPNEWYAECTWGKWPDAGWMPEEEARRLIEWCAGEYARTHQISPLTASDPSQGSDTTETKNAAPEPNLGRPGASDGEGTPCD